MRRAPSGGGASTRSASVARTRAANRSGLSACSTPSRARAARDAAAPRSLNTARIASASAAGSGSNHKEPASVRWLAAGTWRPSTSTAVSGPTKSRWPPAADTTSGSPAAIASAAGTLNPSPREGSTTASAPRNRVRRSAESSSMSRCTIGASSPCRARSAAMSAPSVLCGLGNVLITSLTGSPAWNDAAQAASSTSQPLRGKAEDTCRNVKGRAWPRSGRPARAAWASSRGANPTTRTGRRSPLSTSARATNRLGASTASKSRSSAATVWAGTTLSSQKKNAQRRSASCPSSSSPGTRTG